ncbi:MAG: hypothetical protein JNL11_17085 [Bdellovibrionaceae bacterium]|nr:hypothetical protein [Pseudobdellovibrionaceae bacterium]
MFKTVSLILLSFVSQSLASDECKDWFAKTGAKPGKSNCEITCAGSMIDMNTFSCTSQCTKFCEVKCPTPPFWEKILNAKSGPFKPLKTGEREKILWAISRLPKGFIPKSLRGLVRATKVDFLSPQNPASSSEEFIIFFPPAFSSDIQIDRVLFHEVVHHLIINEWSSDFLKYKKESGWIGLKDGAFRKGEFVETDGKASAEENFANNIEYFVFDQKILKETSKSIFDWINKNFKNRLKMENGCDEKNISK